MEKQMMIYERAVPVSKDRHKNFSVQTGADYGFAGDMNAVPLLAAEFENASREYPIIFIKTDDGFVPTAMVGLRDAENLFLTAGNGWDAKYIPAFIRRYPFVFSHDADKDTFTLCIDETYPGCNQDGEGEALFDEAGESSDYLSRMFGFTKTYQHELQKTRAFCDVMSELDILTPGAVNFQMRDGKKRSTKGLLSVDRERLNALPAKKLSELAKSGDLEKIYAHLLSLGTLDTIGARLPDPKSDLH